MRWMKTKRKVKKMSYAELRDLQIHHGLEEVIYVKSLQLYLAAIVTPSWTAVASYILKDNTTRRSYVIDVQILEHAYAPIEVQ